MTGLQGLNRRVRRGGRLGLECAGECIRSALRSRIFRDLAACCWTNIQFRPTRVRFSPSQASGPARGLGSQRSNRQIKGCSILAGNGSVTAREVK